MDAELSVLLGKAARPVVLNGKLLCVDKSPVLVSRSAYQVEYKVAGTGLYLPQERGEELIATQVSSFNDVYGEILNGTGMATTGFNPATIDSFTGAIILESKAFTEISRAELHDGTTQFQPRTAKLLRQFITEYTENWFEIYLYLFNRRISAQHMPFSVRSHFVAGLFQPLMIETKSLKSPLSYGENRWFYNIFREYEEFLTLSGDNDKRVSLSCVAMCDIANIFRAPVMFDLDRKVWVFIMELLLLKQLDDNSSHRMIQRYSRLFSRASYNAEAALRRQGRLLTDEELEFARHQNYAQLFARMTDYTSHLLTQLRMV